MTAERLDDDGHQELMGLCRQGMLFAVQDWLNGGRPTLRPEGKRTSALVSASELGFHSLVDVLTARGIFEREEYARALEFSCRSGKLAVARLLVERGAPAGSVDFFDLCNSVTDRDFLEFMLVNGTCPMVEDGFAHMAITRRTKPLLGLFLANRDQFPALEYQASLALLLAIRKKRARAAALLLWAKVDPLLRVEEWPREPAPHGLDMTTSPMEEAVRVGDVDTLRKMKAPPDLGELWELLRVSTHTHDPRSLRYLLSLKGARTALNWTPPPDLEGAPNPLLVDAVCEVPWRNADRYTGARLEVVELLLDHGAHRFDCEWGLDSVRRNLYRNPPGYAVPVIRLLWLHRERISPHVLCELVDKPKYRNWLRSFDPELAGQMLGDEGRLC